jgi:large subunit ribosomal protein L29
MKAKDLRERSVADLRELEKSLAKDIFTARFKNFTNRLDDTSTISKARRDLARVKTLLRQQELNAAVIESAKSEAK